MHGWHRDSERIKDLEIINKVLGEQEKYSDEKVKANDGDNGNYYDIILSKDNVKISCIEVIEHLNMTFAEGEAFKAIWRKAAARLGNAKDNHDAMYDAKKVRYYGESMVRVEKLNAKSR